MASRGSALPGNQGQRPNPVVTPPPAYGGRAPPNYSDDEEDGDEEGQNGSVPSAIKLHVKCPLSVNGDHNIVGVDTAVNVTRVAQGIFKALKEMGVNGHGVPLVDEDGRPRPITITASAEITITGSKNFVNDKPRQQQPTMPQQAPRPAQVNRDGPRIKREREGSEEAEPKRSRME
ncbi:hypothetical protein V8E51_003354 [Hyaloscypha variabilis]